MSTVAREKELTRYFQPTETITIAGHDVAVPQIRTNPDLPRGEVFDFWQQYGRGETYDTLFLSGILEGLWKTFSDELEPLVERDHKGKGRFMEQGIGNGKIASQVLNRFPNTQIVGVDLSVPFLEQCREKVFSAVPGVGGRLALWQADFSDLPFADESFDMVYGNMSTQYGTLDQQAVTHREAHRVLRANTDTGPGSYVGMSLSPEFNFGAAARASVEQMTVEGRVEDAQKFGRLIGPVGAYLGGKYTQGVFQLPTIDQLGDSVRGAGFRSFDVVKQYPDNAGWVYLARK